MSEREITALPVPIDKLQEQLVVNVYPVEPLVATTTQIGIEPDYTSTERMEDYLIQRFQPQQYDDIVPQRVPTGTPYTVSRLRGDGWFVSPKAALFGTLAGLVILNSEANAATVVDNLGIAVGDAWKGIEHGAEWIGHEVHDIFASPKTITKKTETPHTPVQQPVSPVIAPSQPIPGPGGAFEWDQTISLPAPATHHTAKVTQPNQVNVIGESTPNPASASSFVHTLEKTLEADKARTGTTINSVIVTATGEASDDLGSDTTLGHADARNAELGKARGDSYVSLLKHDLAEAGIAATVKSSSHENILDARTITELTTQANAAGFPDVISAMRAYEAGEAVPAALGNLIDRSLTKQRGVKIEASIATTQANTQQVVVHHYEPLPSAQTPLPHLVPTPHVQPAPPTEVVPTPTPPEQPTGNKYHWKLRFIPFLVPPIPKFKWFNKLKTRPGYIDIPGQEGDNVWLRLYDEALNEDGKTLKPEAWSYSRKAAELMRDDRITSVLRHDYNVPTADAVEADRQANTRVMFVDHTPSDETLAAFKPLLTKISHMQDRTVGDKISAIFVYPKESAGKKHGDPSRIALGIDKQDDANVLGFNLPLLNLVEMHMPTNPTTEQLADFMGALHTLAHELAGHGSDILDTPITLQRITGGRYAGSYVSSSPWQEAARDIHGNLLSLVGRDKVQDPISFDITRKAVDREGNVVTITERVAEDATRLNEAHRAIVVGTRPTQYGSGSAAEHYAETAAILTTGTPAPYDEADITLAPIESAQNFATGFEPSSQSRRVFEVNTGAIRNNDVIVAYPGESDPNLTSTFRLTTVARDPLLAKIAADVRSKPVPRPEDMIRIVARVRR